MSQLIAFSDPNNQLSVLAVGVDAVIHTTCQTSPGSSTWQAWTPPSYSADVTGIAAAVGSDGLPELFAVTIDGSLWVSGLTAVNGPWGGFVSLGGVGKGLSAAADALLGPRAFVVGTDGKLWTIARTAAGSATWGNWSSLGGPVSFLRTAAISVPGVGITVVALGKDNAVYSISQTDGGNEWGDWQSLGGYVTALAPVVAADGTLALFVIGNGGAIYCATRSAAGTWGGWQGFGGTGATALVAGRNGSGGLEVFIAGNGTAARKWQTVSGGTWNEWSALPAIGVPTGLDVVLDHTTNGLVLFAAGPGTNVSLLSQAKGWSAWDSLGPTGGISISFDSQLIEGFLHTASIIVDSPQSTPAPIAPFVSEAGRAEALIIQNGVVLHAHREPLSDSGWNVAGLAAGLTGIAPVDSAGTWGIGSRGDLWRDKLGRWARATPVPGVISAITMGNDGVLRANLNGASYSYDDVTKTWVNMNLPFRLYDGTLNVAAACVISANNVLYALANDQTVMSSTDGNHWTVMNLALPSDTQAPVAMGAALDGTLWFQCSYYSFNTFFVLSLESRTLTQVGLKLPLVSFAAGGASSGWWAIDYLGRLWQGNQTDWTQATTPFPLSVNPTVTPAIGLAVDGTAWVLDGQGTVWRLGDNGWARQMVPTGLYARGIESGGPISEVTVALDSQGAPQAFMVQHEMQAVLRSTLSANAWSYPSALGGTDNNVSLIGTTHGARDRQLILYGVDGRGNLAIGTEENDYNFNASDSNMSLAGVTLALSSQGGNGSDACQVFAVIGGRVQCAAGTIANPLASGFNPVSVAGSAQIPAMARIVRMPSTAQGATQGADAQLVLVLDTDQNLWLLTVLPGQAAVYTQISGISGMGLAQPAMSVTATSNGAPGDAGAGIVISAVDNMGVLWQRTLTPPADPNQPWALGTWRPLNKGCAGVAAVPMQAEATQLFYLDDSDLLNLMYQSPVSFTWTRQSVHQPSYVTDTPVYVSQYVTEVTVMAQASSGGGVPLTNQPVEITAAAEPTGIWIHGELHEIGPGVSVTIPTDHQGKISVSSIATGLHTAELTFTVAPSTETLVPATVCQVYPPENVQNRLGTISSCAIGSAQSTERFNQQPVAMVDQNAGAVGNVTTAVNGTISLKQSQGINGGTVVPKGVPGAASRAALRNMVRAQVVAVHPKEGAMPGSWDSFWDGFVHDVEDLFAAIRHAVIEITDVVVCAAKASITFVAKIGEDIADATISFFVTTIHAVESALITAFRWIVSTVEKVIDWVKEVYNWSNIKHVKDVIEAYVNQLLTNTITSLSGDGLARIQGWVQDGVSWLNGNITSTFNNAGSVASGTVQGQAALRVQTPVGSSALTSDKVKPLYDANQVKCNTPQRHANTYVRQGGGFTSPGNPSLGLAFAGTADPIAELASVIEGLGTNFLDDFRNNLAAMKPRGFFGYSLAVLIDLVESIIEAIVQAFGQVTNILLGAAADAIGIVKGVINTEIDIPVLSWIYRELTGHPLTVLDLSCLIFAFPVVVVTATMGQDPGTIQLPGNVTWPSVLPPINGATPAMTEAAMAAKVLPVDQVFGIMAVIVCTGYTIVDIAGDSLAATSNPVSDGIATLVSVLSLVASAATQTFTAPVEQFQKGGWDTVDTLNCAGWAAGFAPFLLNCVYFGWTLKNRTNAAAKVSIAKLTSEAGVLQTAYVGGAQFAVGLTAFLWSILKAEDTGSILAAASTLAGAAPVMCKLLASPDFNLEMEGKPVIVLYVIDGIGDVAVGALTCASSFE